MNRKQLIVVWALAAWLLLSLVNATRWACPYWPAFRDSEAAEAKIDKAQKSHDAAMDGLVAEVKQFRASHPERPPRHSASVPLPLADSEVVQYLRARGLKGSDEELAAYGRARGLGTPMKVVPVEAEGRLRVYARVPGYYMGYQERLYILAMGLEEHAIPDTDWVDVIDFYRDWEQLLPSGVVERSTKAESDLLKAESEASALTRDYEKEHITEAKKHMRRQGVHRNHWLEWQNGSMARLVVPALAGLLVAVPLFLTLGSKASDL